MSSVLHREGTLELCSKTRQHDGRGDRNNDITLRLWLPIFAVQVTMGEQHGPGGAG